MVLIPKLNVCNLTSENPASLKTFKKESPSGKANTDSPKYLYATLLLEIIFPTLGIITLK